GDAPALPTLRLHLAAEWQGRRRLSLRAGAGPAQSRPERRAAFSGAGDREVSPLPGSLSGRGAGAGEVGASPGGAAAGEAGRLRMGPDPDVLPVVAPGSHGPPRRGTVVLQPGAQAGRTAAVRRSGTARGAKLPRLAPAPG